MLWERPQSFLLWVILVLAVPRVWSLFRRRDAEEARYYECTGSQRMVMGFLYFGLIAALATGMHFSGAGAR
jgi:phosphate starvation-inducible membrane PsiE